MSRLKGQGYLRGERRQGLCDPVEARRHPLSRRMSGAEEVAEGRSDSDRPCRSLHYMNKW